ncbi:DNA mismatch repair protein MutT [Veronia nyctiphanis]|uniref:DNA mismatch repair protein MutT n=1 Tax=Veronia nyctiphanis TaxID=1278244 RepID=A0A4V1LTE7_9GAMM|nr:NUDIX hydrolase [Veronia nyctiphanis]RXJ74938.1 DNA mismatch repair protein MutT [Veronia nyctiphanis]
MDVTESEVKNFNGAKLATFYGSELIVYKRDNIEGIPYPDCWDFPGGGRENNESPEVCALREFEEEFSVKVPESRIHFKKYVKSHTGKGGAYFLALTLQQEEFEQIQFGDEGQYWQLMTIEQYLAHPKAIPALKERLTAYLSERTNTK